MRVLVTNDDGVQSEGLRALRVSLSREHEVWVLAPDRERSGVSHALTLGSAGRVRKLSERIYSCSGTPVDCVLYSILGALGPKPDIVIAGINRGPNLGTDIVYSGTCGAAREAAFCGIPGIALSCASRESNPRYGAAAAFALRRLSRLAAACSGGLFINVNAPSSDSESLPAVWSDPCSRVYGNGLQSFEGPDGLSYCFLTGGEPAILGSEASDHEVVASGRISVSPVLVQPQVPPGFRAGPEFR